MAKRILIAAGGTGGHIIPALAVAAQLQSYGVEVHWLGTSHGLEQRLVPAANIPLHRIAMPAIRGKGLKRKLMAPIHVLRATGQAWRLLKRLQADAVIGFGGFVSAPCGLAARLARKPLILHEQNAAAGLANRYLARIAQQVYCAFPNSFASCPRAIVVGNPVRKEIIQLPEPSLRFTHDDQPMRLLILGGSQGTVLFNQMLPQALALLPANMRPEVKHSAGKDRAADTKAAYEQQHVSAEVTEFITDMAQAYAWADLVICRSGALTVTELTAAGIGSILIPFPFAADDHQSKNAAWLQQADAAVVIPQSEFSIEKLAALLSSLSADKPKLLQMANNARKLALPQATEDVARGCMQAIQ